MMACDAGVDEPSGGFAIYVAMPAIVISFPVGVPVSKEPVKQAGQDIVYDGTQPESRDFKPRKFILNAATPGADRLRPARSSGRAARRSPCHSGLARARARAGPVAGPGPPDRPLSLRLAPACRRLAACRTAAGMARRVTVLGSLSSSIIILVSCQPPPSRRRGCGRHVTAAAAAAGRVPGPDCQWQLSSAGRRGPSQWHIESPSLPPPAAAATYVTQHRTGHPDYRAVQLRLTSYQ